MAKSPRLSRTVKETQDQCQGEFRENRQTQKNHGYKRKFKLEDQPKNHFKLEGRPKNHGQKKEVQISNLKVDKSVLYKWDRSLTGKHFDQQPTKQHQRHPLVLQNQGANTETQDQSQRQLRENRNTQKNGQKKEFQTQN